MLLASCEIFTFVNIEETQGTYGVSLTAVSELVETEKVLERWRDLYSRTSKHLPGGDT
jgi:hypothetical protein